MFIFEFAMPTFCPQENYQHAHRQCHSILPRHNNSLNLISNCILPSQPHHHYTPFIATANIVPCKSTIGIAGTTLTSITLQPS